VALLSVRQLAGILHANIAAPLFVESGRGVFPQAPTHPPDARPPFHPQGGTAPNLIGLRVGQTLQHFDRRSGFADSVKNRATFVA
jgi:hypothetical protein